MPRKPKQDDPDYLPDNVPECHQLIKDLRTRVKQLEEGTAELKRQLEALNRKIFGRSSARVSTASLTGTGKVFYDQSTDELESEKAHLALVSDDKPKGGGRTVPRQATEELIQEHTLAPADLLCPCCNVPRETMGFVVSNQIEFIQPRYTRIRHVEFQYSCPKCKGQVTLATKPYQPIDKGYAGPGLLANIAVSKFGWHLPLYRQSKILKSFSISIARSTLSRWLKQEADLLNLLYERMHQLILDGRVIQSDETTMPVIKKGLGKTHNGRIWIYRGDDSFPYILYQYTDTKHGYNPEKFLEGFSGILQTDGASVFNAALEGGATAAKCMAHAYRYFEAARKYFPEEADFALGLIKSLYDIEKVGKLLDEKQLKDLRQKLSKPKLACFKSWLEEQQIAPSRLPKEALLKAVNYCLDKWDALCFYADTGFVNIDNNNSENGLRPAVLGRKNFLFCGSSEGGTTAAVLMSFVQTCYRLDINPQEYLEDVFRRLPSTPTSQIDQFLPDKWKQAREISKSTG